MDAVVHDKTALVIAVEEYVRYGKEEHREIANMLMDLKASPDHYAYRNPREPLESLLDTSADQVFVTKYKEYYKKWETMGFTHYFFEKGP